jgi:hypothetical protein
METGESRPETGDRRPEIGEWGMENGVLIYTRQVKFPYTE